MRISARYCCLFFLLSLQAPLCVPVWAGSDSDSRKGALRPPCGPADFTQPASRYLPGLGPREAGIFSFFHSNLQQRTEFVAVAGNTSMPSCDLPALAVRPNSHVRPDR